MPSAFILAARGYPAMPLARQLAHQRCVLSNPLVLGEKPLTFPAPTTDRDRPVSRRSKPSSRTAFIGEQPNPWELLHPQDAMSRHRGAKPPRRCERSGEILVLLLRQVLPLPGTEHFCRPLRVATQHGLSHQPLLFNACLLLKERGAPRSVSEAPDGATTPYQQLILYQPLIVVDPCASLPADCPHPLNCHARCLRHARIMGSSEFPAYRGVFSYLPLPIGWPALVKPVIPGVPFIC
jgi:hypothetical protein